MYLRLKYIMRFARLVFGRGRRGGGKHGEKRQTAKRKIQKKRRKLRKIQERILF
jgi:hypothetical protein